MKNYFIPLLLIVFVITISGCIANNVNLQIMASSGGTTEPEPGVYYHEEGEELTVVAVPEEGYEFQEWEKLGSSEDCVLNETVCKFNITENSFIAAHFIEKETE